MKGEKGEKERKKIKIFFYEMMMIFVCTHITSFYDQKFA
jgi:hypothetical protein